MAATPIDSSVNASSNASVRILRHGWIVPDPQTAPRKPYDVYLEGDRICVLHRVSFCKYVKTIDAKFYSTLTGHSIFTTDLAPTLIAGLISTAPQYLQLAEETTCQGDSKEDAPAVGLRHETDSEMIVSIRCKLPLPTPGIFLRDEIHIACTLVEEKDEIRMIRMLQGEVSTLTERLVESDRVIRRLEIHRMYSETVATLGPEAIPPPLYHFAMKVFAAELDGNPYIFPIIGPNSINGVKVGPWDGLWIGPYWLRSIVCVLPMAFPVWHRLEWISCRRLIVTNDELNYTSGIVPMLRINGHARDVKHTAMNGAPIPGSVLSDRVTYATLHPNVRSIVVVTHATSYTLITCSKINPMMKNRMAILPTASKGEIVGAKIMTNARFSDTTARCLDAPLSWEAEELQGDIAAATESIKRLDIPTF